MTAPNPALSAPWELPAPTLRRPTRRLAWAKAAAWAAAGGLLGAIGASTALAQATDPAWAELAQADTALGQKLIAQHRCSECHVRRVGGDGSAIYKPQGRINRPAALLAMVERCNTELNLQLFPDDVAAIAKALNQAHYGFKPRTP